MHLIVFIDKVFTEKFFIIICDIMLKRKVLSIVSNKWTTFDPVTIIYICELSTPSVYVW